MSCVKPPTPAGDFKVKKESEVHSCLSLTEFPIRVVKEYAEFQKIEPVNATLKLPVAGWLARLVEIVDTAK